MRQEGLSNIKKMENVWTNILKRSKKGQKVSQNWYKKD